MVNKKQEYQLTPKLAPHNCLFLNPTALFKFIFYIKFTVHEISLLVLSYCCNIVILQKESTDANTILKSRLKPEIKFTKAVEIILLLLLCSARFKSPVAFKIECTFPSPRRNPYNGQFAP